jgi:hypothetical protein
MILNAHSYYSLRYGVVSNEELVLSAIENGYEAIAITDINNSSGVLEFVKIALEKGIRPIVGMEFRKEDELLFVALARNNDGYKEINDLLTQHNLYGAEIPKRPILNSCYIIYPIGSVKSSDLNDNEFIGIKPNQLTRIATEKKEQQTKYCILQTLTYKDFKGYEAHKKLRAIDHNILLSQVKRSQIAGTDESIIAQKKLLRLYEDSHLIF